MIEALRENGVESSISVKRLLGLADREMKRLYEQGEARYAQQPAGRAAEQSAVLHRALDQRRSARGGGARLVPPERTAAGG